MQKPTKKHFTIKEYLDLEDSSELKGTSMFKNDTAKYTKINSGYMGQLIEWPEVVTEGKSFEDCRESLRDALNEMIKAYKQLNINSPSCTNRPFPLD